MPQSPDTKRLEGIIRSLSALVKNSEDVVVLLRLIVKDGLSPELKKQAEETLMRHSKFEAEYKSAHES